MGAVEAEFGGLDVPALHLLAGIGEMLQPGHIEVLMPGLGVEGADDERSATSLTADVLDGIGVVAVLLSVVLEVDGVLAQALRQFAVLGESLAGEPASVALGEQVDGADVVHLVFWYLGCGGKLITRRAPR